MYFEAVFSFYVLLYHFVGHSFFGLIAFRSFSNIIKWNFSLTLAKLNFYVDMSVWLFVGKQYYRLTVPRGLRVLREVSGDWRLKNAALAGYVPPEEELLAEMEENGGFSLHEGAECGKIS